MVDTFENILGIVLEHKTLDYSCLIISCYLPPESSKYGQEPEIFTESLLNIIYMYNDCDDVFIEGDWNARIGDKPDFIPDIDDVAPWISIDARTNKHGDVMLSFLQDARYAVLNGRVTPVYNMTSFTRHGTAVVDYVCTKYEALDKVLEFKVLTMNDLISEIRAYNHAFFPGKMSDHSVLLTHFQFVELTTLNGGIEPKSGKHNANSQNKPGKPKPVKYRVKETKPDFMASAERVTELLGKIDELLTLRLHQEEIDCWYQEFIGIYHMEMNKFYRQISDTPRS